jgi:TolB protein
MEKILFATCLVFIGTKLVLADSTNMGIFSDQMDIGSVGKPGTANFDPAKGEYAVTGGGANMWFTNDAFHFVWKKISGDASLAAGIRWVGTQGNEHRKACLIIRQSLDPDSAYADAALHGNGLASLQYRETPGGQTHEIISSVNAPEKLRIEKRGDYVTMSVAAADDELQSAGGTFRLQLQEPFYIGLGVCAHDNATSEQAVFSGVTLDPSPVDATTKPVLESTLEVINIASTDRRVIHHTRDHIEAPNWSRDGKYFLFNSAGRIYKLPVAGGKPELLDTGDHTNCNNDHGISPDGTLLAISDQSMPDKKSRIHLLPIAGGTPRLITINGPSYWHGWSPDGKTLAYCAERDGEFDIYTIPVASGEESRLTTAKGLDDGPDYSPDGKYIYFNSERSGLMQIWRMKPDGSDQEPVTNDEFNNWFAHPSPDGRWIVMITFPKAVSGHPANKDVTLRLMPAGGGEIRELAKLFGGQGTINVPSWSPDSRQIAFVSYQLVYP